MSLLLLLSGCLLDAPYKFEHTTVPEDLGDGWPIATPADVGLDPDVLADIHAELLREDANFGTLGLLVAKDGRLVFETYLDTPDDRDHVHHLQSATKSFTSVAAGIAHDQGLLPEIDTKFCSLVGDACDPYPDKRDITLEHLLTMKSGIDLDNAFMAYDLLVAQPDDPLAYLLSQPMYAAPGEEHYYRDADPQLMAYAIAGVTGMTEEQFLAEHLFDPLGIEDWYWEPLSDGQTTGAFGLHVRPRDFGKIGQLMLDGGTWQGERVLSQEWRDASLVPYVDDAWDGNAYGWYWWIYPDDGAYTAAGHGGQFAFFVPEENLLVVQIARPDGELHGSNPNDLLELVRPLWE